MSVYIKGMDMPTSCWECHFGHGDTGVCVVDFKNHGDWDEPHDCPLVPVPPHGRLGDLDRLAEKIHECWDAYPADVFCEDFLDEMPTIIPADKESGK